MHRILLVECYQEVSSFNPVPSTYENFFILRDSELFAERGKDSAIGGALAVFDARKDVEVVPTVSFQADSTGVLSADGWARVSTEICASIERPLTDVDGVLFSMHGAMAADGEPDPEGALLEAVREMAGPRVPIVVPVDLHGIVTDCMLHHIDGLVAYHTYPHVDVGDTGVRAAKLLLRILDEKLRPRIGCVRIPALVRGNELVTRTGCFGDIVREAQRWEREGRALAAAMMIGNPFTDVPELGCRLIVTAQNDADLPREDMRALAEEFWKQRSRMQGVLIPIDRAIAQSKTMKGPVAFTDAADATSSGASGDSNAILRALLDGRYMGRVLAPIIDPAAARAAIVAGVGAKVTVALGGFFDSVRFRPLTVEATVASLSYGRGRYETWDGAFDAGPTAVLTFDNFTVVVASRALPLHDRALYLVNGLDPRKFDLIIVKSPHTEYFMYDAWVEKNFNIDAPGATSANLKTLGHRVCARPIYPLDANVEFDPSVTLFCRAS
ncbi:MAG: M81 family metallopeptidase [Steroidobacteraceae bacterium]